MCVHVRTYVCVCVSLCDQNCGLEATHMVAGDTQVSHPMM